MKKTLIAALTLSTSLAFAADATYSPETESQKLGYTFGTMVGAQLSMGVEDLDIDSFMKGFQSAYKGETPAIPEEELKGIFQAFQQQKMEEARVAQEQEAEQAKAGSVEWLASIETQEGIMKTDSGLLYKAVTEGTGEKPVATDTVKVNYEGSLANGTVFDSSYERGEPISFPLNQVIPGWTEGLQLMSVGSKYELYIPSDLAYGPGGTGPIPPHSALKFVVELLAIETPAVAEAQ
ncbi:FKBP-type peptidyl-prolyl cis-trans isomerase [Marinomonas sp. PE14-40]|uniref:FKBP-type peptidyl-prolyl cis-trans isomerase n=1 Tax=Marinomonas sp. PE14-40 TaxID=3060621 RepID=UPI003F67DDD3